MPYVLREAVVGLPYGPLTPGGGLPCGSLTPGGGSPAGR